MSDQDLVITLSDTADLTVTLIQDTIAFVEIEQAPSEVAVDAIGIEGPPGPLGPVGPTGLTGPKGDPGTEPDLPDFTLIFENQLI